MRRCHLVQEPLTQARPAQQPRHELRRWRAPAGTGRPLHASFLQGVHAAAVHAVQAAASVHVSRSSLSRQLLLLATTTTTGYYYCLLSIVYCLSSTV